MATPRLVWMILAVLYLAFFGWYTSFEGPLSPDETDHYLEVLAKRGRGDPVQIERWRSFMEGDTGDDFVMFNIIEMRAAPLAVDGVASDATSDEVLRLYTQPFLGRAFLSAAHPVFFGSAASSALDLWGIEGADDWSNGGLVRYRSRRDLMEQVVLALGLDIHDYKIAAMEKTIAFPLDPWFQLGDPRLVLGLGFLVIGLAVHLRAASRRAAGADA